MVPRSSVGLWCMGQDPPTHVLNRPRAFGPCTREGEGFSPSCSGPLTPTRGGFPEHRSSAGGRRSVQPLRSDLRCTVGGGLSVQNVTAPKHPPARGRALHNKKGWSCIYTARYIRGGKRNVDEHLGL